jgi:hypothetical protein
VTRFAERKIRLTAEHRQGSPAAIATGFRSDELPATRSRFASAEKFPPLVRLGIFLVGSVASWGVFVLLLRLLFRAF